MENRSVTINYEDYGSREELDAADRALLDAAIEAVAGSYAPYSHFNVGAAVRLADGTVVKGANQENAAYPSGLCAERTAMFSAGALHPGVAMEALAVVCSREGALTPNPGSPCGACRQVMAQYEREAGKPMRIILGSGGHIWAFNGVESLMPFIFNDL
ncbi:MAG: cytidine deaminase [Bacteroidales bacterium]|nr:cytidine deaminase [Bacteroidales bacterium]